MNISLKTGSLICFLLLTAAHGSMAQTHNISSSSKDTKQAPQPAPVLTKDTKIVDAFPIPEPATGSMILLGLGASALASRLLKRI